MTGTPERRDLAELATRLQIILLDVDGVLTDGGIVLYGQEGEAKRFDVQDGMGITLARAAGLKLGIVTSRNSEVVRRRAEELRIDQVFQGARRKSEILDAILQSHDIDSSQVAYIGDDIQDIPIMERIGLPIAVQNAVEEVKQRSVYVTRACGGHGAVREAIEWVLQLRGDKEEVYKLVIGGAWLPVQ